MNSDEFMNCVKGQYNYRVQLLTNKRKSRTAGSADRLLQFKRMAAMRKCTPESAAIDLATKHFTDFLDMADGSHPETSDFDYFRELAADIQNYIDLALALRAEGCTPQPSASPDEGHLAAGGRNVFSKELG